jgi:hypothetical protein
MEDRSSRRMRTLVTRMAWLSANSDEAGHLFQSEAGHPSDLKPDAVPRRSRTAFRSEAGRGVAIRVTSCV